MKQKDTTTGTETVLLDVYVNDVKQELGDYVVSKCGDDWRIELLKPRLRTARKLVTVGIVDGAIQRDAEP